MSSSSGRKSGFLQKCSTPIASGRAKKVALSTTISEIGTNSSSGARSRIFSASKIKKKRLKKRGKRQAKPMNITAMKRAVLEDSDSDWKTRSQISVRQTDELEVDVVTETVPSHERSKSGYLSQCLETTRRDATVPREYSIDADFAPFRSTQPAIAVREEKSLQEEAECLPVVNIPSMIQRAAEDSDEEPQIFPKRYKEPGIRTYPAPPKPSTRGIVDFAKSDFNRTSAAWKAIDVRFDTARSDMLWYDFVSKNKDTVGKRLEAAAKRISHKRKFFKSRMPASEVSLENNDGNNEIEERGEQQGLTHSKKKDGQKGSKSDNIEKLLLRRWAKFSKEIHNEHYKYLIREHSPPARKNKKRKTHIVSVHSRIFRRDSDATSSRDCNCSFLRSPEV